MDWNEAFKRMRTLGNSGGLWKYGQENSIHWIADQLGKTGRSGIVLADEVGMGKTRVAMSAILAVLESGGTVAAVVPPNLLYQWKREWDDFMASLNRPVAKKYPPILLRSYYDLFADPDLEFPISGNEGRWVMISHRFGPPQLQSNSQSWRYLLPVLVRALQQDAQGKHHNSHWQLVRNLRKSDGGYPRVDCIRASCRSCPDKAGTCRQLEAMKKAAQFLRKGNRWRLFSNIPDRALDKDGASKEEFREWFNGENGWCMLGELLGPIDLIVIDEAHKNRGEDSRLEVNLSRIIRRNDCARHIAMTATPMELTAQQWKDLFFRIGEQSAYPEGAIAEFEAARLEAQKHPANRAKVKDLIKRSETFKKALSHFVTRRLRIRQAVMRDLLGLSLDDCASQPHPHRDDSHPVQIEFRHVEDEWKPSIFAWEAIGKAAKGCRTSDPALNQLLGRLKISDSRYAAGQDSETDDSEKDADEETLDEAIERYLDSVSTEDQNVCSVETQGKLRRIQHWRGIRKRGDKNPNVSWLRIQVESDKPIL